MTGSVIMRSIPKECEERRGTWHSKMIADGGDFGFRIFDVEMQDHCCGVTNLKITKSEERKAVIDFQAYASTAKISENPYFGLRSVSKKECLTIFGIVGYLASHPINSIQLDYVVGGDGDRLWAPEPETFELKRKIGQTNSPSFCTVSYAQLLQGSLLRNDNGGEEGGSIVGLNYPWCFPSQEDGKVPEATIPEGREGLWTLEELIRASEAPPAFRSVLKRHVVYIIEADPEQWEKKRYLPYNPDVSLA